MSLVIVNIFGFLGLLITVLVAPVIISRQVAKQRANDKAQDWERQDEVAARAEAAARAIIDANNAASRVTIGKLETIHKLVNSALTASKEATLAALEQTLNVLHAQTPIDKDTIRVVRAKVVALNAEIEQRKYQDEAAQPGIDQTNRDEAAMAEPAPAPVPAPAPAPPIVVSTDPDAEGTPVVIEGTMTQPDPPA